MTRDHIENLLRQHGATLERTKKHRVWRMPDGRVWVVPSSPSDERAYWNNLKDLQRMLGVRDVRRKHVGPRREKTKHRRPMILGEPPVQTPDWRSGLARMKQMFRPVPMERPFCRVERIPMTPVQAMLEHVLGAGR